MSATNEPFRHYGDAEVDLTTNCGRKLLADFAVSEVARPVLSVAGLVDKGFTVTFAPTGAVVSRGGFEEPRLERVGRAADLPKIVQLLACGRQQVVCAAQQRVRQRVAPWR